VITILYRPVLLESCGKIFDALNIDLELRELKKTSFGEKTHYHIEQTIAHLFPRLDVEKEVDYIKQGMNLVKPKAVEIIQKPEITIDQFELVDIKVGLVLEASKHPNAAKLLILKVNTGDRIRQVVSGIAEYYQPEELVGKKLLVVANLKPVKLRNELSEGMILCGDQNGRIYIIEANAALEPGASVK
jgi:methionyl-tRNA synthetase